LEKSILQKKYIRLIYNGVDEQVFRNYDQNFARKEWGLPKDKIICLFSAQTGTANPWKGGEYVSELPTIMHDYKSVLFVNVGGDRAQVRSDNCIDIAYVNDENKMALLYAAADLFIYPSVADNCPLVVLEALSCGTPVVSFRTGGIPELVKHLSTGYVADYKNMDDFIHGIKLFIEDKDLCRKAKLAAREQIIEQFTLTQMVENYCKLYEEVREKFICN
jgi:glycosyltransferase involved in cell wall biosynthesis